MSVLKIKDGNAWKSIQSIKGSDGSDGITPTTTVTQITGGHNVAFSYGTGDSRNTNFNVMDGAGGSSPVAFGTGSGAEEATYPAIRQNNHYASASNAGAAAFNFANATAPGAFAAVYSSVSGDYSASVGYEAQTTGEWGAFTEGYYTVAAGDCSHAEGYSTTASHRSQHVFGEFNVADDSVAASTARGNYVELVGNGSYGALSNARTLDWSGNEKLAGSLTLGMGTNDETTLTASQLASVLANQVVTQTVSGTDVTITGVANTRYICGEVSTISITPPQSGIIDVIFTSGSSVAVLTVPNTVKWPSGFDPTSLEANTTYELNIMDGVYGAVMEWT